MHKAAIILLLVTLLLLVTATRGTYADRRHSERAACTTDFDCAKLGVVGYGVDAEMIRNAR